MKNYRKLISAVIGFVSAVVMAGLIPAPWDQLVVALIGVASSFGVYQATNEPGQDPSLASESAPKHSL